MASCGSSTQLLSCRAEVPRHLASCPDAHGASGETAGPNEVVARQQRLHHVPCEGLKRRPEGVNGSRYKIFAEAEVRPISQVRTTNPLPLEQARLAMEQLGTSKSPRNSTRKTVKVYGDKTAKTARYTEHRLNRHDHKITRRFNWCNRVGS